MESSASVLLIIMLALFVSSVVWPSWKQYRSLGDQLRVLYQREIQDLRTLSDGERGSEEIRLPHLDTIYLLEYLENLSQQFGLRISEIGISQSQNQHRLVGYSTLINLSGSFESLSAFVSALELSDHLMEVQQWSFAKDALSQNLSLRLSLILWGEGDISDGAEDHLHKESGRSNPFIAP